MLNPSYFSKVSNGLVNIYDQIEENISKDIVNRLQQLTDTSLDNQNVLIEEQIVKANEIVQTNRNSVENEVYGTVGNAVIVSVNNEKNTYKQAYELGLIDSYVLETQLMEFIAQHNASATMTYIQEINLTLTTSSNITFQELINQAYRNVASGMHIENAIAECIDTLSKKGIKLINYKNSNWNIDTAVRNALNTAVNKTVSEINMKMIERMGANLVQVTAHYDARPSHAKWQGGIYWVHVPEGNYKNFYETTGYGTGKGLGGWNCRHTLFAYFPELSQDNYVKEKQEYEDSLYKLEQEQRYNERQIRNWKRRRNIKEYANHNYSYEQSKVRYWQARQRKLVNDNKHIYRDYEREQV